MSNAFYDDLKRALVERRNVHSPKETREYKIKNLEDRLDTENLSQAEISSIQRMLKALKEN